MPLPVRPLKSAFACSLMLFSSAHTSPAQGVKPRERLTPQSLPRFLEDVRSTYRIPALGAAIVRGDKISVAVTGVRNLGSGALVERNDAWHLGFATKSMTATLLGMLVEDGTLAWDMTLEKMLPEAAATMNPKFREVTLQQLLTGRAGLGREPVMPYGTTNNEWRKKTTTLPEQRQEFVAAILREAPESEPGTRASYSARNYMVAGAIAERATGKSWEELMQTRLFEPLGMTTAGFGPMATPENSEAIAPHRVIDGRIKAVPPGPGSDNPLVLGPAGTVHCSLEDWGKYARFWMRGLREEPAVGEAGTKPLLRADTFLMLAIAPPGGEYAAAWKPLQRAWGGDVLCDTGSNTLNYCVIWLAPAKNFAALVVTNVGEGQKPCDDVASAMISELSKLDAG